MTAKVTLIIPTTASADRHKNLIEAIESAENSSSQPIKILAIINGNKFSQKTIDSLSHNNRVTIIKSEKASAPNACLLGVENTVTPYYCFIDDDDLYINNAINLRQSVLDEDKSIDLVVTNGLREPDNTLCIPDLKEATADPLLGSIKSNWLASCGGMYRLSSIGSDFFRDYMNYIEWTWLAFKLSLAKKRIHGLQDSTYIIRNTPNSLSKSKDYDEQEIILYTRMLEKPLPFYVKKEILTKIGALKHTQAEKHQLDGNNLLAWKLHLSSLTYPDGYKYLTFTRHLIKAPK